MTSLEEPDRSEIGFGLTTRPIARSRLTAETALSLLDKYVDVTGESSEELARLFYEHTPDDQEDLAYSGRQVRFWLRRERTIPRTHLVGVLGFVSSREFAEAVPEAAHIFQDQSTTLQAGELLATVFGFSAQTLGDKPTPHTSAGFWRACAPHTGWLWLGAFEGRPFSPIHVFLSGHISSGFLFVESIDSAGDLSLRALLINRTTREQHQEVVGHAPETENVVTPGILELPRWLLSNTFLHCHVGEDSVLEQYPRAFEPCGEGDAPDFYVKYIDNNRWNVIPNGTA